MMKRFMIAIVLVLTPSLSMAGERALSFAVSGVVAEVKVQAGSAVKTGDVLAVLDLSVFEANKHATDAAVKATRVILDLADLRYTQTRELFDALSTSAENVEIAKTAQANAKMAHENAKRDAARAAWELNRATLKAPFAGTVSATPGYVGQVVNLNAGTAQVVVINTP